MTRVAALAALATLALGGCAESLRRPPELATLGGQPSERAAEEDELRASVPLPMPRYDPGEGPQRVAPLAVHAVRPPAGDGGAGEAMAEPMPPAPGAGDGSGAVRPVPAPTAPRAKELLGLEPAALKDLIGAPDLRWVEGPARVWQYHQGACVLDIYLRAGGQAVTVTHVEARNQAGRAADRDRCYAALIAQGMETAPAGTATGTLAGEG